MPQRFTFRQVVVALLAISALLVPHSATASATAETLTVPFTSGQTGVQTVQSYGGQVTVTVSGVGQAAGTSYSDAFYVYTDSTGQPITPYHPPQANFTLWINDQPSDQFVTPIPAYNPSHSYTFTINVPSGKLSFGVGDQVLGDNSGDYIVTVQQVSSTAPHKIIVYVGGVCTATDNSTNPVIGGQLPNGQLDLNDDSNATFHDLQGLLRSQYGYTNADFLAFSYHGGFVDSNGLWHHNAYNPTDPINQSLDTSVSVLQGQTLQRYSQYHPNTTFILVGHSLGGLVAFQAATRIAAVSYKPGYLSKVITIDSPLEGVTLGTFEAGSLLRQIRKVSDCSTGDFSVPITTGPMLTLLAMHANLGVTQILNIADANNLTNKRVGVVNFGNTRDCVLAPTNCGFGFLGDANTQWIDYSSATEKKYTDAENCQAILQAVLTNCVAETHSALLKLNDDGVALKAIADAIGPEN